MRKPSGPAVSVAIAVGKRTAEVWMLGEADLQW